MPRRPEPESERLALLLRELADRQCRAMHAMADGVEAGVVPADVARLALGPEFLNALKRADAPAPPTRLNTTAAVILRALAQAERWLSMVEVATDAGRSVRTCQRFLPQLIDAGLVEREAGGRGAFTITRNGRAALAPVLAKLTA